MNGAVDDWIAQYGAALAAYVATPSEAGLTCAYELGRRALALDLGIGALVDTHGHAVGAALPADAVALVQRTSDFLREALAPFEMGLRGYREANALLKRLNDTLEQRVEERSAALRAADRRKNEFLATLAHELRNPLAPVRAAVEILRAARPGGPEAGQATAIIERQVSGMARLIDDLMDVSRISQGKFTLRRERVELARVVADAIETSRPLITAAGHDLVVDLPAEPIHLDADPTRLAQVFLNLLNNAAKYTEPGGRIRLSAVHAGEQVAVTVTDSGIGIPANKLAGVFDLFAQVEESRTRSQGGLGIGLALVRRLVEMHGGTVEATSAGEGQGSSFRVRLATVPAPVAGPQRATPQPATHLRVLVVDDNRDAADTLALLLQLTGNTVQTAYDGATAVRAAGEFRPQVAILDIGLPQLNGHEAARAIRAEPWGTGMHLIALTGWGQDEDRLRSQESGFDRHLVKPIDPAALLTLLAKIATGG